MRINGIGTVRKEILMNILTREGREAVKSGEITPKELGQMYKLEQIKKASKIGRCGDTFRANYDRIPEDLSFNPRPLESVAGPSQRPSTL